MVARRHNDKKAKKGKNDDSERGRFGTQRVGTPRRSVGGMLHAACAVIGRENSPCTPCAAHPFF